MQAALDSALQDEEDVVIGQSANDFLDEAIHKARRDEKMARWCLVDVDGAAALFSRVSWSLLVVQRCTNAAPPDGQRPQGARCPIAWARCKRKR